MYDHHYDLYQDPLIYISRAELKLRTSFQRQEKPNGEVMNINLYASQDTLSNVSHPPISISITSCWQRIVLKLIGKAFTEVSEYNFLIYFESLITRQRMESTSPNEQAADESLMGVSTPCGSLISDCSCLGVVFPSKEIKRRRAIFKFHVLEDSFVVEHF